MPRAEEESSEMEAKRLFVDIVGVDLRLMVVLPCDFCPHKRLLCASNGCGAEEWMRSENMEENLTDEELEAAAQLMELSSQSRHLAEDFLTTSDSSLAEGFESSSILDSRRSYGVMPSPRREGGTPSRIVLNVDVDERPQPRSRSVSEIFMQSSASCKRRKRPRGSS